MLWKLDLTKELRRMEGNSPLYRRKSDLYKSTSVKQLLRRWCREHNVTGVWLWTLNNFICSEYCLRTAGFVRRPNSTPAKHLAVKVTTRHLKCYFRVFNQMSSQVLPGFVEKLLTPTKVRVTICLFERKQDHAPFLHWLKEKVHEKELLSVNKSGRY